MRALVLLPMLFGGISGAKNITLDGLPGVSGLINVKGQQRGEVVWHKIGQSIDPSSLGYKSLFEVLKVNVTTTNVANIKVIFNGGTDIPWLDPPDLASPLYQSVYRKYCASWFGGGGSVNCENVVLPRFGIWAPFGATQIAIVQDSADSIDYSVTFRKEYDQKRAIRMAIGVLLFLFGSVFSHSRPIHYLVGTALGSVGFVLVLLFVGLRFVPGNKPAFAMVGAASATLGAWIYNTVQEALVLHVSQYLPYYVALMAVGGCAGFAYAYKHPLDANSQFLCLLFIRIVAIGLIFFEGPTSLLVSAVVVAALFVLLLLSRCQGNLWACLCDRKPDAPLPDAPESNPGGGELESEEVMIRRRRPSIALTEEPRPRPTPDPGRRVTPARSHPREPLHEPPHEPLRELLREPLRDRAPRTPSTPLEFDFRDVPLPPVPPTPDYLLPPVAPPFEFSPIGEAALLEQLEGKLGEVETLIQTIKSARKRGRNVDDGPLRKIQRLAI